MGKDLRENAEPGRMLNLVAPQHLAKERPTIQILTGEYDFGVTRTVSRDELGVRYILAPGKNTTYVDLKNEKSRKGSFS